MEVNQIVGIIVGIVGIIAILRFPYWFFGEPDDRQGFYHSRGKVSHKNFYGSKL